MRKWLHKVVIPGYLLLCLLLGGSVQGVWRVMTLQLVAIALVAWAIVTPIREPLTSASKLLLLFAILALLLFVVQLVPMPPEVWTRLPGREVMENGYSTLGYTLPWLPVSMAPYDTLATWLTLLPPLALLLGMLKLRTYDDTWLAGALLAGALLGVLLGTVQSLGGSERGAWWHLYEYTNRGAVGFFANRNFMGTLLLVSIPFAVALIASGKSRRRGQGGVHGLVATGVGAFLLLLVGVALNRSSAVITLALPVIAFSALMLPADWRSQRLVFAVAALLTIVTVALFISGAVPSEIAGTDTTSLETRMWIWRLSCSAISDSFPIGFGLGSFEQLVRMYESPANVHSTYVNHAHNDYLELLLEAGLAGLLLMLAFLLWWVMQVIRAWRSRLSSHFARAATIASGAILAHSIVDYPLRTAGLAAVFGACVAIMAQPREQSCSRQALQGRTTKHLVIG